MPKNCLVYVPSPCLTRLCALVLFHVVIESGNVNECFVLEHTGADSFRELLDLFLDVGEERVRTPAPDQHDRVDGFLGKVHEHGKAGAGAVGADVVFGEA